MKIYPTTANFPGTPFLEAVSLASKEPDFNLEHMQLCPQQLGILNEQIIDKLQERFSQTQFRLHANVVVLDKRFIFDASSDLSHDSNQEYVKILSNIHKRTKSDIYSYHAGYRTVSLEQMKSNMLRLSDTIQSVVAIEALYPDKNDTWLINSLDEYEWLAHNVPYALDMSHLQIVYEAVNKPIDYSWVTQMMTHFNCKEIHIAGNDGVHDNHQKMKGNEWWLDLIKSPEIKAPIFTEENYRQHKKRMALAKEMKINS